MVFALVHWGEPATAEERTGWLYQRFGDQGVVLGMLAMGGLMLLSGIVSLVRHRSRQKAHERAMEIAQDPARHVPEAPVQAKTPDPRKGALIVGLVFLALGLGWSVYYVRDTLQALAAGTSVVSYSWWKTIGGPFLAGMGLFYVLVRPGTLEGVRHMTPSERVGFLVFVALGLAAGIGLLFWLSAQAEAYGYLS
ncbi:hypothetical protein GCM10007426_09630 [Alloalcanivorax dieselolei]|nr:hypothetical protein [Alloalcanivorax dieselolei]GGJ82657.1 hypothetical protein GCM10007426_09630 [Alloalcanivorax dieselolei]